MFNIGPEELILLLVVALIFLGPARLPEVARQIGKGLREFRSLSSRAKDELFQNVSLDELPDKGPDSNGSSPGASNGKVKDAKGSKKGKKSGAAAEGDSAAPPSSEGPEAAGAEHGEAVDVVDAVDAAGVVPDAPDASSGSEATGSTAPLDGDPHLPADTDPVERSG